MCVARRSPPFVQPPTSQRQRQLIGSAVGPAVRPVNYRHRKLSCRLLSQMLDRRG